MSRAGGLAALAGRVRAGLRRAWGGPAPDPVGPPVRPARPIRRLLVTGAAGNVATMLRPLLAARYPAVRLTDCRPAPGALAPNEEWVVADLVDRAAVGRALDGCDAVLHLGAHSTEGPFTALAPTNLAAVVLLLEECVARDVPRVVLASTMHVLGMYRRHRRVPANPEPRPDSLYAVTKLFAEQAGRLYADKTGLRVACLRIGHVAPDPAQAEPGNWIGPEDLCRLTVGALDHPALRFAVVPAVAPHRGDALGQVGAARRLGVRWRGPTLRYADALARVRAWCGPDPVARAVRGGIFASRPLPRG